MALFKNSENYILLNPITGRHQGKNYVFKEVTKRFTLLRTYVKNRTNTFTDFPYFCITGVNSEGKWEYGNYSHGPSSEQLPLPEIIYDIERDKVYQFEGQLWDLPTKN